MKDKSTNIMYGTENTLDTIKKPIFMFTMFLIYLCYFLIYFGILAKNHEYVTYLNIFIQLFICSFLIIRFNPFRHHVLRDFDGQLIFASAMFLLTNLIATEFEDKYFVSFMKKINSFRY